MKKSHLILFFVIFFSSGSLFTQWVNVSPPGNDSAYYCIDVVDQNIAYAGKGTHGIIVKTTNGGIIWSEINTPSQYGVNKIHFLNETTGFIATSSGLYKTNSGGSSWITLATGGFGDLFFVSESTGYAINADFPAKLYKTTNGGGNFSIFNMGLYPAYIGQSLCYVNPSEIFALSFRPAVDSSIIFKCTNWDSGWVPVLKTKPACYDISFADANTGIACGNFGVFRRTIDGGLSWQNFTPAGNTTILACNMNTLTTGYIVCSLGYIYKTSNAGINWFTQISGTTSGLYDIDVLPSDNTGFISGGDGVILKTTNGGITIISPLSNELPENFHLDQNYPNPFNPATTIKFSVPVSSNVKLKIYDVTGKVVSEILNKDLTAGTYNINFNASDYSSGIYFYMLEASGSTQVKKMILVK